MHFLIWETLSFNLMYVAACYLVGTGMCHNMLGLLQHYIPVTPASGVRPSTISNIFSSETTGPIKFKFHMGTP